MGRYGCATIIQHNMYNWRINIVIYNISYTYNVYISNIGIGIIYTLYMTCTYAYYVRIMCIIHINLYARNTYVYKYTNRHWDVLRRITRA